MPGWIVVYGYMRRKNLRLSLLSFRLLGERQGAPNSSGNITLDF